MKFSPWAAIPEDPEGHLWDVIVVGTGAGGATAGFNLARLGRSVLFIERGKLLHHDPAIVRGVPFSWTGDSDAALNYGWWPDAVYREDGGVSVPTSPPIGCGAGGSTALFGTIMDRFRPEDFTPRRFFAKASTASLPEAWPITYEEMVPFYELAEQLYRVRGTPDPLIPTTAHSRSLLEPPSPSRKELAVLDALSCAGLNPYRIHSASERVSGCVGCPGMLCPRECRNDAARICLYPALEHYGAKLLPSCRVLRLEERQRVVTHAICEWQGRRIALRGRVFILAANAFATPAILQRSANERFPNGLANSSGLVGRHLMLHVSDLFLLRLKRASRDLGFDINHGVSLNDFYVHHGTKLGNIHAHPIVTNPAGVMSFLRLYKRGLNHLPEPFLYGLASLGSFLHRASTVFASIIEDLPYADNHVTARGGSDEEIVYVYHYPEELRHRARMLYEAFTTSISSYFTIWRLQRTGMLNRGHVCGTCRFGEDPHTSVLNSENRAHDLDNLYVLDASFFPSSAGINPSLTIVANSLRASEKLAHRL